MTILLNFEKGSYVLQAAGRVYQGLYHSAIGRKNSHRPLSKTHPPASLAHFIPDKNSILTRAFTQYSNIQNTSERIIGNIFIYIFTRGYFSFLTKYVDSDTLGPNLTTWPRYAYGPLSRSQLSKIIYRVCSQCVTVGVIVCAKAVY